MLKDDMTDSVVPDESEPLGKWFPPEGLAPGTDWTGFLALRCLQACMLGHGEAEAGNAGLDGLKGGNRKRQRYPLPIVAPSQAGTLLLGLRRSREQLPPEEGANGPSDMQEKVVKPQAVNFCPREWMDRGHSGKAQKTKQKKVLPLVTGKA